MTCMDALISRAQGCAGAMTCMDALISRAQGCAGAMAKFRLTKSLQLFVSIHASVHNHFNLERHLYNRQTFKLNRNVALAEWRQLST